MSKFLLALLLVGCAWCDNNIDYFVKELSCPRSAANFSECATKSIEKVLSYGKDGIPALNVKPFDPMHIDNVTVNQRFPGATVNMVMRDIVVRGASGVQLKHVSVDPKTLSASISLYLPRIDVQGTVDCSGRFILLPYKSDSRFQADVYNIDGSASGDLKTVKRNNTDYFELDGLNMDFDIGSGNVTLTSLDPGKQGEDNTLASLINGNIRTLLNNVKPTLIKNSKEQAYSMFNKVFATIPADTLLPS